ncbi:BrnT family toxin [Rhizobium paknamense]|uniref:Uncharacterized DUF497 family protein n=1 Tax=Rhizobium paknamense TaxID=1206817 RepID=A0ABU0I8J8_9HYPH|nr:BrnT family toxin [Rhizobium paknamense]MDQ0454560.1 uncharacterized DUF497 family protein [Rhizobium paknamense]
MKTELELKEFKWDEKKRVINLHKHGIDFEDAAIALNQPRYEYVSIRGDEYRTVAICPFTGKLIAVIYTMRGHECRIISARAARANERREYYARYS